MLTRITIIINFDLCRFMVWIAEVGQQDGAHIADVFSFIKLNKALCLNADTDTRIDIR